MHALRKNFCWIIAIFASLMFMLGLLYNTFIPEIVALALGIIACIFMILSRKRMKSTLKLIISVILLGASFFLFYTQYAAERLVKYNPTETSVITFVVLKESVVTQISQASGLTFGVSAMMDSTTNLFLKDQITSQIKDFKWTMVADDQTNLDKLYAHQIDVMVLDNSVRDYLGEQNLDFESKTKIIWSVEKSSVKEVIAKEIDISQDPFVILISGIDIRGPITSRSRSDVNILMIVNPTTNKILTISIPRDTYTPLGCRTGAYDKLTHSGIYGINCTVKTIENLIGIDVNYYIRVNFTSFLNIIDVIGKIDVYSKFTFTTAGGFIYKEGMNALNAESALIFARERHSFASGDIQRGLNQQEVIKGVFNKLIQPASLLKIEGIIKSTGKSVDTNLSTKEISKLVKKQIENYQPWSITTSNLSGTGDMQPTYSMGSRKLYVMWVNTESLLKVQANIAEFMKVSR
jgi:LCP family protein required for cell wall assembly